MTITKNKKALNQLLLDAIGFSNAGINTIGRNEQNLVSAINLVAPTFELLNKYSPTYTCTFQGAVWYLENGGRAAMGGNGKSLMIDGGLLFGDDPYRYPDNLPVVQAKGGPGGRPSCGSLPDASENFPVKYLVTDTGFGTGLDIRPNPGIGFPGYVNYFPATKGTPQPPLIRYPGGPAPGPGAGLSRTTPLWRTGLRRGRDAAQPARTAVALIVERIRKSNEDKHLSRHHARGVVHCCQPCLRLHSGDGVRAVPV